MLTTLNSPEGAVFYFEKGVYGYTCKNLDVPESATTLTFITHLFRIQPLNSTILPKKTYTVMH